MQMAITLTDEEVNQLTRMIERHKSFETKKCTLEDAIHECIRTAMYDESERNA